MRIVRRAVVVGATIVLSGLLPAHAAVEAPRENANEQSHAFPAGCGANNGNTAYGFSSTTYVQYSDIDGGLVYHAFWAYFARDPDPDAIPFPAKNNVAIKLRAAKGSTEYASYSSTDDQLYSDGSKLYFYSFDPNWQLPPGVQNTAVMDFVPAFDKRNTPDAHCTATTAPMHGPQVV
jgi:hypothetical protein